MSKNFNNRPLRLVLYFGVMTALLFSLGFSKDKDRNIGDWIFHYEKDDVIVHKKETTNKMRAFRGEKVIHYPISKIAGVLTDNDNRSDWVDRLSDVVELEMNANRTESVVYQLFKLPFPFNPRYYVIKGELVFDKPNTQVTLHLHSVEHSKAQLPEKGVKGLLFESKYVLTMLDNQKTHVIVEVHTDPRGNMPAWVANLVQKEWPRKTLLSLEQQLQKNISKEHLYTKKIFY